MIELARAQRSPDDPLLHAGHGRQVSVKVTAILCPHPSRKAKAPAKPPNNARKPASCQEGQFCNVLALLGTPKICTFI